jgi:hypothetical protein
MKYILLGVLLLLSSLSYAQHDETYVDKLVSEFTTNLKNRNINTYLLSKRYCEGRIEIFKLENGRMCSSKGTYYAVYVFWEEGDKAMIKKIDNCGLFYSLELNDDGVMAFIIQHKNEIKNNPVKPYKMATAASGPISSTEIHSCKREVTFQDDLATSLEQSYRLFDLTNDAKEANLNYASNNRLKVVELDKLMGTTIEQMENKFRRQ